MNERCRPVTEVTQRTPVSQGATDEPLLQVDNLVRYFDVSAPLLNRLFERRGRELVKAVDGISFEIGRGETFSLVGESGCGKSTVARLIVGLYEPTGGSIRYAGTEIGPKEAAQDRRQLQSNMQMIFQDPYASLNPRWRVSDIIAEPLVAGAHAVLDQHGTDAGLPGRQKTRLGGFVTD